MIISDSLSITDWAHVSRRDAWLHHPVLADPSWDSFRRMPGNPVHRGSEPYKWPVNGFFFEDPVSGNWYLFIGHYLEGYAMPPGAPPAISTLQRSMDRGKNWEDLGPIFPEGGVRFDGVAFPATHAPDVCVIYADGRYHMAFDWSTSNATWESIFEPDGGPLGSDGGAGYAVSERPEGPWVPCPRPFFLNSQLWRQAPFGKYRRFYATSLLRRRDDWLILALTDSGPFHSWGLGCATAEDPEGPWPALAMLLHTEDDRYHPPLLEFFPAFAHDGFVYAPATSLAATRNYQAVFRAPLEKAHEAGAWELWQDGSVWHGEDLEHEHFGIWGQTFAGAVTDGTLRVMYPSRDAHSFGTINLAERPWDEPYREQGFVCSAQMAAQIPLLRHAYEEFHLEAEFRFRGDVSLLWSHRAPLGPDSVGADAGPHRLALHGCRRLRFGAGVWELLNVDSNGQITAIASGKRSENEDVSLKVEHRDDGTVTLWFDGDATWSGTMPVVNGALGFWLEDGSNLEVQTFQVTGEPRPHRMIYLGADALLGAGQRGWIHAPGTGPDWDEVADSNFAHGLGCRCKIENGRAKWNFQGDGFTLWSPKGPDLGEIEVRCDGLTLGTLSLWAPEPEASAPILERANLPLGRHTVVLRGVQGGFVLDCLEAHAR